MPHRISADRGYLLQEMGKQDVRILIPAAIVALMTGSSAFGQTQPTRPSAYPTFPTWPSAWATAPLSPCYGYRRRPRSFPFNPTSPCYTGTPYAEYSALEPFKFHNPTNRTTSPGSESLNEDQAKLEIEAKGYLDITRLEKDKRGVWRGQATTKDGRAVDVTLDLEGNIYSEPRSRLYIRIEPPPLNR